MYNEVRIISRDRKVLFRSPQENSKFGVNDNILVVNIIFNV